MKRSIVICSLLLLFVLSIGEAKDNKNSNAKPVNVKNTPLPVRVQNQVLTSNANDPALQPFVDSKNLSASALGAVNFFFDVPAGKRLVIECVSVHASVPTGQTIYLAELTTIRTFAGSHFLTVSSQGDVGASTYFTGTHPIKAYVDGGTAAFSVSLVRSAMSGLWYANATVTGYLIDIPTPAAN